jgi:choice-of-anchor A domain-containing protein
VTASGGSVTLNGSPGQVKVFNWDVNTVGAVNAITLNATAGEVVVINIHDLPTGQTTWAPVVNFNGSSQADSGRVLWNLVGGVNLNTGSRMWDGSILGIGSTVTSMQGINGQVFATSLEMSNGSELHYDPLVAIPEPPYAALMAGIAVCWAAAIARRRTLLNRVG